jgi:class 3 adenylate cyclase/tetratricopeptide (TPR) repeat protein
MTEREQLEKAIAGLEAQRAALGDAIVDPAIAALRSQLDALLEQQPPEQQRKLVTVLFCDIVGSTRISQGLDPEEVIEVMDGALQRLAGPVETHGGRVTRFMGDGFKAVFGLPLAHENDAEQAIRAGLSILDVARIYAAELEVSRQLGGFDVRIGINTGLVVAGGISEAEDTVMGLTVNLAARLESAAPSGGLLISHYTYQHARGVFDVEPLEPIVAKGFAEPVPIYVVKQAKPRAFRIPSRGVEGVDTPMVGRQTELEQLQEAYTFSLGEGQSSVVTITGEAGVGKSRLLYEFMDWIDLRPETIHLFQGRATERMSGLPFGLLRDVLTDRFEIQDSDPGGVAREKLELGIVEVFAAADAKVAEPQDMQPQMRLHSMRAHFIGHLIGLDFSDSPHLSGILSEGEQVRQRAFHCLAEFFRAVHRGDSSPIVVFLEDIHWADEGSLDIIDHIAQHCLDVPLLVICPARPTLFERRPRWGSGHAFHRRIDLTPLPKRHGRHLADALLQRVAQPPPVLRELLVSQSEGNPYYMEELVRMFLDEGVIRKREQGWHVEVSRLATAKVPSTLVGVLQARLDSLSPEEKVALQWSSVVGQVFWDAATTELGRNQTETETVLASLAALANRELIFGRDRSAFVGTEEYIFKQALLHEVTYESVLRRFRRAYHRQVADWLVEHGGDRVEEYTVLIAEHYERAGDVEQALTYLCRAAERACGTAAYREMQRFYERALALLPEDGALDQRAAIVCGIGRAQIRLGDAPSARETLEQGFKLAHQAGNGQLQVAALIGLGVASERQGEYAQARAYLERALAPESCTAGQASSTLLAMGNLALQQGELDEARTLIEQGLAHFTASEDRMGMARAHARLGTIAARQGRGAQVRQHAEEGLSLARAAGDRLGECLILVSLGAWARSTGDLTTAQAHFEESRRIAQEIGDLHHTAVNSLYLGLVFLVEGDLSRADGHFREALARFVAMEELPNTVETLLCIALLRAKSGDPDGALALLGLALAHPAVSQRARDEVKPHLAELEAALGPEAVAAGLERGRGLDFETVVEGLLR